MTELFLSRFKTKTSQKVCVEFTTKLEDSILLVSEFDLD